MDKVYSGAVLTVVPATATMDVQKICAGLPRYNETIECRLQKVASVRNLQLIVPFESIIGLSIRSRWSTRGWTFQEGLLSRRILFFTDSQVYFQCSRSVFSEDGVGEGNLPTAFISPASNLWNPGGSSTDNTHFGSLHLQRWPFASNGQAVQEYGSIVSEYTQRHLTHPTDILDAFHGVQNVMQQSLETEFWFGMPERFLDFSLLWILDGPHKRRIISPKVGQQAKYLCPSWSWAGWDGNVLLDLYFHGGLRGEVQWFLVNHKEEATLITSEDIEGQTCFPQPGNRRGTMLSSPGQNGFAKMLPRHLVCATDADWRNPKHLVCWTTVASFRITGTIAPLSNLGSHWSYVNNFAISDNKGRWVGSILLDKGWAKATLLHSLIFPFILLSRSEDISYPAYPEVKYFDSQIFHIRPWCFMNVMLLEFSGNIATRLGVGVIHEDAWFVALSAKRLVRLE